VCFSTDKFLEIVYRLESRTGVQSRSGWRPSRWAAPARGGRFAGASSQSHLLIRHRRVVEARVYPLGGWPRQV